jgi:hypothetical protein
MEGYTYGGSQGPWPGGGDVTALGWAQLIRMYALRERDVAAASAPGGETEEDDDDAGSEEEEDAAARGGVEGGISEVRSSKTLVHGGVDSQVRQDVHGDACAHEPAGAAAAGGGAKGELQSEDSTGGSALLSSVKALH